MKKALCFFTCMVLALIAKSQHPSLNYLHIASSGNAVVLTFEIKGGSTCNGIQILRSSDNVNYFIAGTIDGVCGSASSPVSYSFTDENAVSNAVNYYKIELNGLGISDPVSLFFIKIGKEGHTVFYSETHVKIFFMNASSEEAVLNLFSLSGTLLHRLSSESNVFEVDYHYFSAGVSIFTISVKNNPITSGIINKF